MGGRADRLWRRLSHGNFCCMFGWIWLSLLHCSGLLEACCWLDSRSSLVLLCPSSGLLCPTSCELTENALCFWCEVEYRLAMETDELSYTNIDSLNNLGCDNGGETLFFISSFSRPNQPSLLSCPLKSRTPALCPPWWPSALLAPVCQCLRIGLQMWSHKCWIEGNNHLLDLLAIFLIKQPSMRLAFNAGKAHCCFMFGLPSRSPRSFLKSCFLISWPPDYPRCRT